MRFTGLRIVANGGVSGIGFAPHRRIAPFYRKNFADRRTDREKRVISRAELFGAASPPHDAISIRLEP